MKFATIKALVEEENKPMYAVIVLSEALFGFAVPEKDRTKVIEVNPTNDLHRVSVGYYTFIVEELSSDDIESMFILGFTVVGDNVPFRFFNKSEDAVEALMAEVYLTAHTIRHPSESERKSAIDFCKTLGQYDLEGDNQEFTDQCDGNRYWFRNYTYPTAGVDGTVRKRWHVATCRVYSLTDIRIVDTEGDKLWV